jgi:outer membrane protein OmpA-like peptidoglycan-associated protein
MGVPTLHAQNPPQAPVLLGLQQMFELGIQSAQLPVYAGSFDCGTYTLGNSFASSIAAGISLPALLGDGFGATARIGYSTSSGSFSTQPVDVQQVFDEKKDTLVTLDRQYVLESSMQTVGLDLLLRWQASRRFIISGGASMGYRFGQTFTQSDQIDAAAGFRFTGGETERSILGAQKFTGSSFAFSALAGVGYTIPFGRSIALEPALSLRYDILSPVQEGRWQTLSFGAGLGLAFDLSAIGTPDKIEGPPRGPVTASIELFSVDRNNQPQPFASVTARDHVERRLMPLPSAIWFDSASAMLPRRYVQLSPAQTEEFHSDSLAGFGLAELYHNAINIIAMRMKQHPSSHIQLHGSVLAAEPSVLGKERARVVLQYMEDVWGIDGARIEIAPEEKRGEFSGVEITSDAESLLATVETAQLLQSFDPPVIRLKPEFHSDAGIRSWRISITQNGREISRYTNQERGGAATQLNAWTFPYRRDDSAIAPIVVELAVEDSVGMTATARDRMPLLIRRSETGGDERMIVHILPFAFRSSALDTGGEAILAQLAARLRDGAHITIEGHVNAAEMRQDPELARRRSREVESQLRHAPQLQGLRNVTITTSSAVTPTDESDVGEESEILDRRVDVVIEQAGEVKGKP